MATPFLGEIRACSFDFAPRGWALCNGQLLPINQNQALFSLLGTTYGGNGQSTFALPNLQGRVPLHFGNGFVQGQSGGEEQHTLALSEMPTHAHTPAALGTAGTVSSPAGALPAVTPTGMGNVYGAAITPVPMQSAAVGGAGSGQPHSNVQPYLTVNFVIALQGIFPSRN